ncbi:MAG: hypothetical protein R3250_13855, partial [Melioribacteraceae bacterium]|nr:hypothetical protein [Melioribacteraceae bacterium]
MKKLIIFTIIIFVSQLNAQRDLENTLNEFNNPDELVTIAEYTPFDKALEALSQISERKTGKRIVSTAGQTSPIGVEINKLPFMKALVVIVQYNNLEYEERENVIVVRKKMTEAKGLTEETYASLDSREVKISAIFFEADVSELRERGINWQLLMSNADVTIDSKLRSFTEEQEEQSGSQQQQTPPEYLLGGLSEFTSGEWSGTVE